MALAAEGLVRTVAIRALPAKLARVAAGGAQPLPALAWEQPKVWIGPSAAPR
jgi:hypothetical protein